ncbi:MAG: YraN family protein [Edaphocola sp.]
MAAHRDLGKRGEDKALDLLLQKGHRVLHRNHRMGHKEVDVISLDKDVLVFTEIKTRSGTAFGFPEEAVDLRKQAHLKAAAEQYCLEHPQYPKLRFDVISLVLRNGVVHELLHFEDAFY